MNRKLVVGVVLVVLAVLAAPNALSHATTSYGLGRLTGVVLIGALGVWLVRGSRVSRVSRGSRRRVRR